MIDRIIRPNDNNNITIIITWSTNERYYCVVYKHTVSRVYIIDAKTTESPTKRLP